MNAEHASPLPLPPARKRRGLLALFIVAALVLAGLFAFRIVAARAKKAQPVEVKIPPAVVSVAEVVTADVPDVVAFTGAVRPKAEVDVFAKAPGRVERVLVEVGATVKAGELLAVIEAREQVLQRGQTLAQVEAAQAGVEQALVNAETALTALNRAKELRAANAIPQVELERAESAHKAALAAVKTARAQVALGHAAAGITGRQVMNARITSPIAGVVSKRHVDVGTQASPGQPMFQVQDLSALTVEGTVTAKEALKLTLGTAGRVRVDELEGETFNVRVSSKSPSLDAQTRRAAVEVEIVDGAGRLLPNMFAHVELAVGERKAALVIPSSSVITLPSGKVVYVVKDGVVRSTTPTLGIQHGDQVVVESGLAAGDRVVTSGDAGLTNGAAVVIKEREQAGSAP